jgi:Tol biopolymer transport system component
LAASPDGRRLVYYVNGQPHLRDLSRFDVQPVPASLVGQIAFSPDGRSLAGWSNTDNTIKRADVGGGAVFTVCRAGNVSGLTWTADAIVSGQGADGVLRCPLDGGSPQQIVKVEAGEEADSPQMLPDGKLLVTVARTADGIGRWDRAKIVVYSLRTGDRTTVVEGGNSAQYLPSGHLVYVRSGVLFAVGFDLARNQTRGQAKAVIEGIRRASSAVEPGAQFTISDNGDLFYIPGRANIELPDRILATTDRSGDVKPLAVPPGPYAQTRVSRDGKRIAVGMDDGRDANIWTYEFDGKGAMQKLPFEGHNRFPIWSPDGASVAFQSDRGGDLGIFVQRIDGTAAHRLTTAPSGQAHIPEAWSPNGDFMLVSVADGRKTSLSVLALADGHLAQFAASDEWTKDAAFSPNGKWVVYSLGGTEDLFSPGYGVFVKSFPDGKVAYQAPKVGIDFHPVWASDTELIYVTSAASGRLASVTMTTADGVRFRDPELFPARVTGSRVGREARAWDILPNGRFVGVIDAPTAQGGSASIDTDVRVVLNWFEELKALVPVP